MGLGTEEEKKRNVIQDKNGLWWSATDIDNIHAKLHELLIEKARTVAEIFQCPFCAKEIKTIIEKPRKVYPDTPMNMNVTGHFGE